jgi:hypothetical protein
MKDTKCPMCGHEETEHTEVLRLLQQFDNKRAVTELLLLGRPDSELGKLLIAASDLYRKLKTQ